MKDYEIKSCVYRNVYQDKHTGEVTYGKWLPCGSSSSGGNNNMGNNGRITTSSGGSGGGDRYRISNPFNTKPDEFSVYSPLYKPQIQPYVRPEFVPYTQPANSFLEEPKYISPIVDSSLQESVKKQQVLEKQITVGKVLSEASKYGLNTPQYQSQVNQMSADDLSKQYQNWKVLEKQIMVGKVLSEADKYGLNNSFYQQQVNTMSDAELSKQYQEWKALEKRILVGKVLSQYSEATGKSIDEIDEQTKSDLNNADQASLEKIYKDNIQNKQVVLAGTILSQLNEISGKPLNELDQETIDFVNNSELATLQLIYNTNVNQKQLLENGTVGLYELYFRLPVNVSYKILYNPGHFNSDMNKLLTRQLDLNNISNLNLSNNQIADDGAKVIADSLSKGEMPNLKKLHLEGNKVTTTGTGYLSKALDTVEQGLVIVLKTVQNASKAVAQFAIKEMLHIAKSNGISTKEVLTTQETIEYCKKGTWNVTGNITWGVMKCFTNADKPIAVYEMDFQYLATTLTVNIMNPLKKPFQWYCMTESTVFSVVDEDFANCLTGLDSELNND